MECFSTVSAGVEGFSELVDFLSGAAEYEGGGGRFHIQQASQGRGFVGAGHNVRVLPDFRFFPRSGGFAGDTHPNRVGEVALCDPLDTSRHSR